MGGSPEEGRFYGYLRQYHYLGLRVVGENLKYLVQARDGQDVACLLLGAAAWQAGARDRFVGWTSVQRAGALSHSVNNTRFLPALGKGGRFGPLCIKPDRAALKRWLATEEMG